MSDRKGKDVAKQAAREGAQDGARTAADRPSDTGSSTMKDAARQAGVGAAASATEQATSRALKDVPGGDIASSAAGSLGQKAIGSALASPAEAPSPAGASGAGSSGAMPSAASSPAGALGGSALGSALGGAALGSLASGSLASGSLASGVLGALTSDEPTDTVRLYFETDALPQIQWEVARASIEEALNAPYAAEVELRTDQMDVEPTRLLGGSGTLMLERGDHQQRVVGMVSEVREGSSSREQVSAWVTLVPALWALGLRKDSRIFQNQTVPEIIEQVLAEGLAPYQREVRLELDRSDYLTCEYRVQYDETDLAFVHRLMEEEGIVYWFDHEAEREVMVMVDHERHHAAASSRHSTSDHGDTLWMVDYESGVGGHECVREFQLRSTLRPTKFAARHYDWTRPSRMVEEETESEPPPEQDRPAGAASGPSRETYEHDSRPLTLADYDAGQRAFKEHDAKSQVRLRRELDARDAHVGEGLSTVTALRVGARFDLAGHRQPELNGSYVVVSVAHQCLTSSGLNLDDPNPDGSLNEPYTNRFVCVPAGTPYRPARTTPKPRIAGLQTATVVGPAGEEIHTDEHGRIKVQFHWDRIGARDDRSSCFVRVMQPWSGAGWGFVFLPRIGMEVAVTFLHGDPDQPLITGAVYNGEHAPPYALPDEKTKSTLKTNSSPGGEGYNELTFEDKAGEEQIIVHAQKDYNETVLNNHSTSVGADQSNSVSGNQSTSVSGNRTVSVTGNETHKVDKERKLTVTHKQTVTCEAELESIITGPEKHTVANKLTEEYGSGRETTIKAGDTLTVQTEDKVVSVTKGGHTVNAKAHIRLTQNENHYLLLKDKAEIGTSKDFTVTNGKSSITSKGGKLCLSGAEEVSIVCGKTSSITLNSDGTITFSGKVVKGTGGNSSFKFENAGVSLDGPKITSSAVGINEITGGLIKIN